MPKRASSFKVTARLSGPSRTPRAPRSAQASSRRGGRTSGSRLIMGVDLGGTNINVGLVDAASEVLAQSRLNKKTQAILGVGTVIDRIADAVRESCEQAGVKLKSLGGVGIGAAGAVDPRSGVVLRGGNLGFNKVPLAERLGKKLGLRVYVENDVNAAVYGEWKAGACVGATDALGVWIGTGVGGGLVLNNQLYNGGHLTAGEIGHMTYLPGAPTGRRSLEQNCSRTAVAERLIYLVSSGHASALKKAIEEERKRAKEKGDYDPTKLLRSRHVADAYRKGDELTIRVVHETAEMLGTAIAGVVTLLSLPNVVLGGGFTEALGEPWVREVRNVVREKVFPADLRKVEVVGTALRDHAGIVGAAILARENL